MNAASIQGQSAVAWINDHTSFNRGAFSSIATVDHNNQLRDLAERACGFVQAEASRQARTDQRQEVQA